jgi:hypothetical protein
MTPKATQEELQAATNATLRAHATSDEAKALVARLAAMVDQHAHAAEALHWPNINARITLRSKQKMEAVS